MARSFDGVTQRFERAGAPFTTQPATIAAWAKSSVAIPAVFQAICLVHRTSSAAHYFGLYFSTGKALVADYNDGGGSGASTSSGTYTVDTWHACAAVFASNASRTSYLDGVASTTNTTSLSDPGSTVDYVSAGYWQGGGVGYITGALAELAIWDVALTAAEVTSHALGVSPRLIRPGNLIRYVPFRKPSGDAEEWMEGLELTANGTPGASDHPRLLAPRGQGVGLGLAFVGGPGTGAPVTLSHYRRRRAA